MRRPLRRKDQSPDQLAPLAVAARYRRAGRRIEIEYQHGATIAVPMLMFQEFIFLHEPPTDADLRKVEVWGAGTAVFFPRLETFLHAQSTLHGIFGSQEWMDTLPRMRVLRSPPTSRRSGSSKALVELHGAQIGLIAVQRRRPTVRRSVDGRTWRDRPSERWIPIDDWTKAQWEACVPLAHSRWWMRQGWWISRTNGR